MGLWKFAERVVTEPAEHVTTVGLAISAVYLNWALPVRLGPAFPVLRRGWPPPELQELVCSRHSWYRNE
jgi:hypothetical protein